MARLFDGVNDLITVSDNALIEPDIPATFILWIRTTQGGNTIIWEKNGNNGYSIQMNTGGTFDNYGGSGRGINDNANFNDDIWTMITLRWETVLADSTRFLDDTDDTIGTPDPLSPSYGTENMFIGSRAGTFAFGGDLAWCCLIDNVSITDNQITAMFRGANPFGMGIDWDFIMPLWGNQDPEPDWSGNGNTGAVTTGTSKVFGPPVELIENYL